MRLIDGVVVMPVPLLITRYTEHRVLTGTLVRAPNFRASMRRVIVIINTSMTMMAATMQARRNCDLHTKRHSFVSVIDAHGEDDMNSW
ncbi:hypothetical protein DL93DRAFT_446877 [Clavulina sp. PMI_390]|nr:hypothetical protein DL93DRAFT_446877 [Clavulina sp. PMI_390]